MAILSAADVNAVINKPSINTSINEAKAAADNKAQAKDVTGEYIIERNAKYDYTQKLDSTQTAPSQLKTMNFKQDYVVIIRKKPYYAATSQQRVDESGQPLKDKFEKVILPDENYLRVYQVNNFTNVRVSTSTSGRRSGTANITIRGGERVVCANKSEQDKYGWGDWNEMLNGWLNINEGGTSDAAGEERRREAAIQGLTAGALASTNGKKWSVGEAHWANEAAAGVDFKSLTKTREAKYGWRFAEKADWEPMDEVWIFGKSRTARQDDEQPDDAKRVGGTLAAYNKKGTGEYKFLPIFFGYIDSVTKTFTANKGGLLISITARDHLKLMDLSRIVNSPTLVPGITSGGGIDIRFNVSPFGSFDLNQPLADQKGVVESDILKQANLRKYALQNIFSGEYPYEIVQMLGAQAGIPDKYLTSRVELIKQVPFLQKVKPTQNGDLMAGEMKTRLSFCNEAADKLFLEFFADEEGNLVLKIPSYALGVNRIPANNGGIIYPETLLDEVFGVFRLVDAKGDIVLAKTTDSSLQEGGQTTIVTTPTPDKNNVRIAGADFNFNVEEVLAKLSTQEIIIDPSSTSEHGSLYNIAQKYLGDSSRWTEIAIDNGINDPTDISPGDKINVHINELGTLTQATSLDVAKAPKPSVGSAIVSGLTKTFDSIGNSLKSFGNSFKKPEVPIQRAAIEIGKTEKNVDGKTLSERTDMDIPAIRSEFVVSFTLIDSDNEIYNMFEIGGETLHGVREAGKGSVMTQIRRAIPDIDSICRFGFRPHPGIINTPLVSNVFEAELVGLLMLMKSQANRYSGSITVIDDSAIKVGNPIRVHMYDEHPHKEIRIDRSTNKENFLTAEQSDNSLMFDKSRFPEQSVFYVTGIERNIDPTNVSYMTLQVKAGRMMGQTSIYDICLPLYQFYFSQLAAVDITKSLKSYQAFYNRNESPAKGNYTIYKLTSSDSFEIILLRDYNCTANSDPIKAREIFYAMIALNPNLFGIAAQQPNSTQMNLAIAAATGQTVFLPINSARNTAQMMQKEIDDKIAAEAKAKGNKPPDKSKDNLGEKN